MEEKILLSEEGYEQYQKEIENLETKIRKIRNIKAEAYKEAPGDGWHDNFPFEDATRQEDILLVQKNNLLKKKKDIVIVERKKTNKKTIDLDDIVTLELTYEEGETEILKIQLVGKWKIDDSNHIQEISLNSPLGKALYQNEKDDFQYKVNDKIIKIRIISIDT